MNGLEGKYMWEASVQRAEEGSYALEARGDHFYEGEITRQINYCMDCRSGIW